MGKTAGSPAAVGGGRSDDQPGPPGPRNRGFAGPDERVAVDLHDSWRLAFVVVADRELATKAVTKAFIDVSSGDPISSASRVELLEATLRISLTRAADNPECETASSVTAALWRLSGEQRAALWLSRVIELDNSTLGVVLGVTPQNAGHIASRAGEWLDVALDHESGPLCEREVDLADFTAGNLDGDEAWEIQRHLPTCPTCRTKLRASEELADLNAVLARAVPEPPASLTIEALEQAERTHPTTGTATLADAPGRIPAMRPLAACCAALILVGVAGISLIRPATHSSNPIGTSDPRAIVPSLSNSAVNGGFIGSSANLPVDGPTTITVTTSSIPAVTFPTIPTGKSSKR
jgi:hypothetical protein